MHKEREMRGRQELRGDKVNVQKVQCEGWVMLRIRTRIQTFYT